MTPREFFYQVEGEQWRFERNTLTIVSAFCGKSVDELMGRDKAYRTLEEAAAAGESLPGF